MRDMYEQFINKFGFNDGCSVPAEAEAYRDLLVKFLNHQFEDNNLEVRATSTSHNPVTICWWDKENDCYSDHGPKGLNELFELVDEMDDDPIESLITVTVTVNPDADKILMGLKF